jgi:2-C-methyl-D-erythritol 4-phosphate cytidylyltransferase
MDAMEPQFHVVIPCAGSGSRFGLTAPKQYALLAGKPMVVHTLEAFSKLPGLIQGVLVVAPDDNYMSEILKDWPQPKFLISQTGGATRAQSVVAGLNVLELKGIRPDEWVLVHDAARCLVTHELISRLIATCFDDKVGGLLALPLPDTLKTEIEGRVSTTVNRSGKWLAQTPQMFRLDMLKRALLMAGDQVTDESSAIEAMGFSPLLVPSASYNFKVTFAEDMQLAQSVLSSRSTHSLSNF